jgi:hypothetical protein
LFRHHESSRGIETSACERPPTVALPLRKTCDELAEQGFIAAAPDGIFPEW